MSKNNCWAQCTADLPHHSPLKDYKVHSKDYVDAYPNMFIRKAFEMVKTTRLWSVTVGRQTGGK